MHKEHNQFVTQLGPLGFGGAAIGNLFQAIPDEQAASSLAAALEGGVRYVDTAPFYGFGLSEKRIGRVLETSHLKESVIVSSKVGRRLVGSDPNLDLAAMRSGFVSPEPYQAIFDYSYDAVMRSWEQSRLRLGDKRIDILFAHDLGRHAHGDNHAAHLRDFLDGGYKALRTLRDCGEIAAIGLGVNEVEVCIELLGSVDLDLILLAGRYTLLEQSPLDLLFPLCALKGVQLVIGGPYNSGILATGVTRDARYNYSAAPAEVIAKVAAIERICADYGVPLATAALQFPLGHPSVAAVLPGLADESQVRTALSAIATRIPTALWDELKHAELLRLDAPTPRNIAVSARASERKAS